MTGIFGDDVKSWNLNLYSVIINLLSVYNGVYSNKTKAIVSTINHRRVYLSLNCFLEPEKC